MMPNHRALTPFKMLVSNRFLTGPNMCDLLKYYSNLVGMDLWEPAPGN